LLRVNQQHLPNFSAAFSCCGCINMAEANNYPSLPWQEQVPIETEVTDFNSPGDFVVKIMNYDFQAKATTTVFSHLAKVSIVIEQQQASATPKVTRSIL
jgi:hypothetical protein